VHDYCRARGSEKGRGKRDGWIPRFPIVLKSVEVKSKLYELSLLYTSFSLSFLPFARERERERERKKREKRW